MGATIVATGPNGTREIAASEFYTGFLESALAPDELLTEIRIPKLDTQGWSFQSSIAALRTGPSLALPPFVPMAPPVLDS